MEAGGNKTGALKEDESKGFFSGERKGIGCAECNDCVRFF